MQELLRKFIIEAIILKRCGIERDWEKEREREWKCVRERKGKELDRGTEREIIKTFKDI